MKANALIALGAVAAIGSAAVVVIGGNKADATLTPVEAGPALADNGLSAEFDPLTSDVLEKNLGVDVDSEVETMRTLTKEMQKTRDDNKRLAEKNRQLTADVERLLGMEKSLGSRIDQKAQSVTNQAETQVQMLQRERSAAQEMMARLETRLKELESGLTTGNVGGMGSASNPNGARKPTMTAAGYDIGAAGIPNGLGFDADSLPAAGAGDTIIWKQPMDATIDQKKGTVTLPDFKGTSMMAMVPGASDVPNAATNDPNKKPPTHAKAYTIPANATLVGSTSMTALLGRIPIDGSVKDPYPFKAIVSSENLASNGLTIPGLEGIVVSGVSTGDWTLGCTSGRITSMTFTFQDGSISTFPEPSADSGVVREKQPFGWISDSAGIPCVTGKRLTNAVPYLAGRIGLGAASAYAEAIAEGEYTTTTNADGDSARSLTGEATIAARNKALAGGLDEVGDWLDKRQNESFDAIYVPPGVEIHLHIDTQVAIDYPINGNGRKLVHDEYINLTSAKYKALD